MITTSGLNVVGMPLMPVAKEQGALLVVASAGIPYQAVALSPYVVGLLGGIAGIITNIDLNVVGMLRILLARDKAARNPNIPLYLWNVYCTQYPITNCHELISEPYTAA